MLRGYLRGIRHEGRLFYFLCAALNGISALVYLVMALGDTKLLCGDPWEVQWLRYAAWALEAPITVTLLGLTAGAHWAHILGTSFFALVGLAAGFAGLAVASQGPNSVNSAWPLLAFALAAGFAPVACSLSTLFRAAAHGPGGHPQGARLYDILAFSSLLAYAGYAVVWGTADGGLLASPLVQADAAYTALDIVTKVAFALVLVGGREGIALYGSLLGLVDSGAELDFTTVGPAGRAKRD